MTNNPPKCPYWHYTCKDFFEGNTDECTRDPQFCMVYWDYIQQDEENQTYEFPADAGG